MKMSLRPLRSIETETHSFQFLPARPVVLCRYKIRVSVPVVPGQAGGGSFHPIKKHKPIRTCWPIEKKTINREQLFFRANRTAELLRRSDATIWKHHAVRSDIRGLHLVTRQPVELDYQMMPKI